jgi:hypothetical protein
MPTKKKARRKGEPIPNAVCQDNSEFKVQPTELQHQLRVSRLTRRYAISAALARTIAELAFAAGCPR